MLIAYKASYDPFKHQLDRRKFIFEFAENRRKIIGGLFGAVSGFLFTPAGIFTAVIDAVIYTGIAELSREGPS